MPDVPPRNEASGTRAGRVLIVGCGALGRELVTLTRGLPGVDVTCLPAELHNRPERIPAAVAGRIRTRGGEYDRVFVAYADCGTGGRLDAALAAFEGIERIPGAHCYEFYAGAAAFAELQDDEPGTFYLTDFLARQFETIVVRGLGLDRHPELLELYFGNYRRVVYLAQTDGPDLVERARAAAARLGLAFELRRTGLGELSRAVEQASGARATGSGLEAGRPTPTGIAASATAGAAAGGTDGSRAFAPPISLAPVSRGPERPRRRRRAGVARLPAPAGQAVAVRPIRPAAGLGEPTATGTTPGAGTR